MKQQSIMEDSGMGNVPDDHKTDETVRSISADCLAASASPRGVEPSGSVDSGPKDSSETAGRVAGSAVLARLRSSRSTVRICSIIGVLCAAVIVLLWFPHGAAAWTNPLQQIDAPAHYYFIRKILDEGIGAATHLWPNDEYYPPLFHLMAAGLISLAKVFGIDVSLYAAFNVVWLFTSALIWPIGVQLYASYFTRRIGKGSSTFAFIAPALLALVIPSLGVASACHPFQMLASGPLIAFGLATTLLPFWLYATLRFFDAIMTHERVARWGIWFLLTAGICVFAHPRIVFTWALLMGPFVLTRLPWKIIVGCVVAVVLGAVAFLLYMMSSYQSDRYFNPASWFHTFVPNRTVPEALRVYFTENIAGPQGWFMAVVVVAALTVCIAAVVRPRRFMASAVLLRRDAIAVLVVFALVGLVYVCSTALTGWFPNIVTAAWYRAETRPLTMIPFGVLTLIVFSVSALLRAMDGDKCGVRDIVIRATAIVVLAALAVSCQIGNSVRSDLASGIYANMTIDDSQPNEQLTATKKKILKRMVKKTGLDSVVVSDPLNGSMYATAMYGADMLFPIYNPKSEKNGAIFGQTERAFASGDGKTLTNTVCPLSADGDVYFLSMGEQAPSLQMFTFKEQYDMFHDQNLIDRYAADGTMRKVQDYSKMSPDSKGWALYQFKCQ